MLTSCCSDKYNVEAVHSRQIDKGLERERRENKRQVRILLLGAGESGKSTFLKQMRIIHQIPFSASDLSTFQHIVYSNTVQGMRVLCDARNKLNLPWQHASNEANSITILRSSPNPDQYTFIKLAPMLKQTWADSSIKLAYSLRHLYQLSDSVCYFLDEIDRLTLKDYSPSLKDILLTRRATKGIYELRLEINNIPFTFYDIGGQRSQRGKWLACFDSITSLIFLAAVSEFDQVLAEDKSMNRLLEAQTIFSTLINARVFRDVSMILFLNKYDLLLEKLHTNPSALSSYFPDYAHAPLDLAQIKAYLLSLFTQVNRCNHELYSHWTTAVNTDQIRAIFNDVKATILRRNLNHLMLQ